MLSTPLEEFPVSAEDNYASPEQHGSTAVQQHTHAFAEILFVRQGRVLISIANHVYNMDSNQCVLILPGTIHSLRSHDASTPFFYDAVHFPFTFLASNQTKPVNDIYERIQRRTLPVNFIVTENVHNGTEVLGNVVNLLSVLKNKPIGYEIGCRAYLDTILFHLVNMVEARVTPATADTRMQGVFDYIERNYMTKINVDVLAGLCCLSKFHFIRNFRAQTYMTPIEYINALRIRKACELLKEDNEEKIISVSMSVGFNDLSNFNRLFKRTIGVTPAEYRKRESAEREQYQLHYEETNNAAPFHAFMFNG